MDDSLSRTERTIELTTNNGNTIAHTKYLYFGDTAYFSYVEVNKLFRSNGLGTQLIKHTLDILKDEGISEVYLIPKSAEAVTIFKEKLGFEDAETVDYVAKSL